MSVRSRDTIASSLQLDDVFGDDARIRGRERILGALQSQRVSTQCLVAPCVLGLRSDELARG